GVRATGRVPRQAQEQRVRSLHTMIVTRTGARTRTCIRLEPMKTTSLVAALAAILLVSTADARPRPHGFTGAGDFEANKKFGLGLELGDIAGLTGKLFVT